MRDLLRILVGFTGSVSGTQHSQVVFILGALQRMVQVCRDGLCAIITRWRMFCLILYSCASFLIFLRGAGGFALLCFGFTTVPGSDLLEPTKGQLLFFRGLKARTKTPNSFH